MKKLLNIILRKAFTKLFNFYQKERFIISLSNMCGIDLLTLAYKNMGIMKYQNYVVSGEEFVINNILPACTKLSNPVFFDVGANEGGYSKLLLNHFPNAAIYSFEPVPDTFCLLEKSLGHSENIRCFNIGLGAKKESINIYTYDTKENNKHASIYSEVITELHGAYDDVKSTSVAIDTLDHFCEQEEIDRIDFLKIDTEGNELSVLQGAKNLLKLGAIKIIQFEFGEMNIISHVFLKDFYDHLDHYSIYRLDENRLIDLKKYRSRNEIFAFQNFLAIRNDIKL